MGPFSIAIIRPMLLLETLWSPGGKHGALARPVTTRADYACTSGNASRSSAFIGVSRPCRASTYCEPLRARFGPLTRSEAALVEATKNEWWNSTKGRVRRENSSEGPGLGHCTKTGMFYCCSTVDMLKMAPNGLGGALHENWNVLLLFYSRHAQNGPTPSLRWRNAQSRSDYEWRAEVLPCVTWHTGHTRTYAGAAACMPGNAR